MCGFTCLLNILFSTLHRDELILFNETGVLTADGWIEYNYDKYPTVEVISFFLLFNDPPAS